MVTHLWFFAALFAAVLWGVAYTASEKLLKSDISPAFLLLATEVITIPIMLLIVLKMGNIKEQIGLLTADPLLAFICVLMAFSIIGGNLLIFFAMSEKNATLVSLIEIAYPIFVFIFSWIFLKEIQINWQQAVGGLFIFIGVVFIYLKS